MNLRRSTATAGAALSLILAPAAWAGVAGQPAAPAGLAAEVSAAAGRVSSGSDTGGGRGALIALVEKNAAADIADLLAPALTDGNTYTTLVATFEDAREAAKTGDEKRYILYNIARTHYLRARLLPQNAKAAPLAAAARAITPFEKDRERDPAVWELAGDTYSERLDTASAEAAYKKMQAGGGSPVMAQYKLGVAYHRGRRYDPAQRAYEAALRADQGSGNAQKEMYHRIYQALASLFLTQGNDPAAERALLLSARAQPDPDKPYKLQTSVANALLRRGRASAAYAYAQAALKVTPDDIELKALRDAAEDAGGARQRP